MVLADGGGQPNSSRAILLFENAPRCFTNTHMHPTGGCEGFTEDDFVEWASMKASTRYFRAVLCPHNALTHVRCVAMLSCLLKHHARPHRTALPPIASSFDHRQERDHVGHLTSAWAMACTMHCSFYEGLCFSLEKSKCGDVWLSIARLERCGKTKHNSQEVLSRAHRMYQPLCDQVAVRMVHLWTREDVWRSLGGVPSYQQSFLVVGGRK